MFNKKDPVADAVKKIMEQNDLHRQVEQKLCEELGIVSRKQLPHEHQANYDALLEQRMKEAVSPSEYSEKQKKLAKVGTESGHGGDPKKIDAPDLKAARKGHASHIEEEMQDSRNPLPPASAKERIRNKLGTGPKSSFDNDSGMADSEKDRDAMNKKIENLDEKMSDDDKASRALQRVVAKYRLKDAAKETRPGYVKKQSQEWYNKMTKRANAKIKEEVELDEAAKSKAQQKIMGMALAMRRGKSDTGSKEVARIAADMPEKELEKFAKTKHKGLPEKVKKMDKKDD